MLHNILAGYIEKIDRELQKLENAYVESYEIEILNPERVDIRTRIRFYNDYLLELNEAVYLKSRRTASLGYRYHFQDGENKLVFRYDNTPHFPKLASFPDHKHIQKKLYRLQNH